MSRWLIVNADDFGLSAGVNRGILQAHVEGIVTSTSLMVRGAAVRQAADLAREHPGLSVGLHVDLGEWICRGGAWEAVYEVVPLEEGAAVGREINRQLAEFERLMGGPPTHLDSHQHVHRGEPVQTCLTRVAEQLGVPLRHVSPHVRYCGAFYGQDETGQPLPENISTAALVCLIETLDAGTTELCCHPGCADDLPTMYRAERCAELQALCDPSVRAAVDSGGVRLISFRDIVA